MRALPAIAPDLGTWAKVILHRDCHAKFDYALYSAPFTLVGQTLWLRATDTAVSIFQDYRLVAAHLRCRYRGQRRTVLDHLPPDAREFFRRDRSWCLKQASAIGPNCTAFIDLLLGDRIVERLRGAQGTLELADRYGSARLEAACARALAHNSAHYRTVKTILAGGHDLQPLPVTRTDPDFVYGRRARFHRDAQSLFGSELADDDTVRH